MPQLDKLIWLEFTVFNTIVFWVLYYILLRVLYNSINFFKKIRHIKYVLLSTCYKIFNILYFLLFNIYIHIFKYIQKVSSNIHVMERLLIWYIKLVFIIKTFLLLVI